MCGSSRSCNLLLRARFKKVIMILPQVHLRNVFTTRKERVSFPCWALRLENFLKRLPPKKNSSSPLGGDRLYIRLSRRRDNPLPSSLWTFFPPPTRGGGGEAWLRIVLYQAGFYHPRGCCLLCCTRVLPPGRGTARLQEFPAI
jgi:hypothetical protein